MVAKWSPDGNYLLTAELKEEDGKFSLQVRDVTSYDIIHEFQLNTDTPAEYPSPLSLAISNDSQWATVGTVDSQIIIFDLQQMQEAHRFRQDDVRRGSIECLAYSADGQYLATGSTDQTVRLYQTEDWTECWQRATKGHVKNVAYDQSNNLFFADERNLVVIEGEGWKELRSRTVEFDFLPQSIRFSNDDQLVFFAHEDVAIRAYRSADLEQVGEWRDDDVEIVCLEVHPNGELLIAGTDNGLALWHLPTNTYLGRCATARRHFWTRFSPDGQKLVTGVHEIRDGRRQYQRKVYQLGAAQSSQDDLRPQAR